MNAETFVISLNRGPQARTSSRGALSDSRRAINFLLGRVDEARSLGEQVARSLRSAGFAADAFRLLGDIATHPDRFDAETGEACYRKALALAEPRGMRPLVGHCHLGLGTLYRRTGKPQDAIDHLNAATTMYREMDMRFWLEQAEAVLRG
jgi:hypothetical protein